MRTTTILLITAVLTVPLVGTNGSALADINYDATAAANAFDVTAANQSIPLGLLVEGEGPVAQSHQTSLDTSDAFAAFPYPGDTVAQLPGLLGGLVGVTVPSYPLVAQTSNGDKPASTSYPGIELTAQSTGTVTQAHAVAGSSASGGTSTSQVVRTGDGAVTAIASSDANGLVLGDVLTVSGEHAEATARRDADGTLTRAGHLSFGHLGVPGLEITIPKSTPTSVPIPVPVSGLPPLPTLPPFPAIPLPLGGQTLPAPDLSFRDGQFAMTVPGLGSTAYAIPAQAALDALRAAGIKADYQAGRSTLDGVVSPGLVLTTVLPAPPSNPAGITGPTTVTLTVGLATASVSGSVLPDAALPPPSLGDSTSAAPGNVAPGIGSGVAGIPLADLTGAPTSLPPVVSTAPQFGSGLPEPLQLLRLGKAQKLSWLYLLFVASALLCFGSTTILRQLGVRVRWRS